MLVYAPDLTLRRWIEHELFGEALSMQLVDTLADVVTSLTMVPPPWPQALVIDTAAISPLELELLGTIRAAGWAGRVIAIGDPSAAMQRTLGVDLVLDRRPEREKLRNALKRTRCEEPTVKIRRPAR